MRRTVLLVLLVCRRRPRRAGATRSLPRGRGHDRRRAVGVDVATDHVSCAGGAVPQANRCIRQVGARPERRPDGERQRAAGRRAARRPIRIVWTRRPASLHSDARQGSGRDARDADHVRVGDLQGLRLRAGRHGRGSAQEGRGGHRRQGHHGRVRVGYVGSAFGRTQCLRPDAVPSGSSGGTGAGVAASFATVGIGEDTGGSIRGPAAVHSLVGLRPTLPLVSRFGMMPARPTTDTLGPIARSVKDAALVLDVIAGYDANDPVTAAAVGQVPETYYQVPHARRIEGRAHRRRARSVAIREPTPRRPTSSRCERSSTAPSPI